MLAVVGGKGGCGRTTTTLGLAIALADRGRSVVAADAVPVVPDLHRRAGVPSEPGIAAIADGADPAEATHNVPNGNGARVAPGSDARDADVRAALEQLRHAAETVLIDCPVGAGPGVTTPLSCADAAVLVTRPTDASVRAAETTAAMAGELGTPITAIVATGAPEPPDALTNRVFCRVANSTPHVSVAEPLDDDRVLGVFRQIAAAME